MTSVEPVAPEDSTETWWDPILSENGTAPSTDALMKFLPAQLSYMVETKAMRRNLNILFRFLVLLAGMVATYSVVFHAIMEREGQNHSWLTGFYWTLTVMSTLGFGDITFNTDLGRAFSILVLVSGVLFLLIVLPFTFIQFFYAPWLEAQTRRRVPRKIDDDVRGHVILASYDPVATSLIHRFEGLDQPYFVLEQDLGKALALEEEGLAVVLGSPEDNETYRGMGVDRAAMVVANVNDAVNTNVAFTVRELNEEVPVVSFARNPASVDILELAGSTEVLQLPDVLGRSLARRVLAGDHRCGIIGQFGDLVVAEAPMAGTPFLGKTLGDGWLREETGLTAVGAWDRGGFEVAGPDTLLRPSTVLILAGTKAQLTAFEELTAIYRPAEAPVVILGGGRVGQAVASELEERGIDFRIVEQDPAMVVLPEKTVVGDAAHLPNLVEAGINEAPTIMVTTSDDATNIYLTIYGRRLRPDAQIISRATLERNVSTLHRAGADFVMSYASMGAHALLNVLRGENLIMVGEGLDLFRVPVPSELAGRSVRACGIREDTGCHLVAWTNEDGVHTSPAADATLPADGESELILVATPDNEERFLMKYDTVRAPRR